MSDDAVDDPTREAGQISKPEDLDELTREWWASDGGDDAFDRVLEIGWEEHETLPALIGALVRSSPSGGESYIGITIVEDLYYDALKAETGLEGPLDLLLAAHLGRAAVFGVLSGVYPDVLEGLEVRTRLANLLSAGQIDWLLDGKAPNRWAQVGITLVDGDSLRFDPNEIEWQRLLQRRRRLASD